MSQRYEVHLDVVDRDIRSEFDTLSKELFALDSQLVFALSGSLAFLDVLCTDDDPAAHATALMRDLIQPPPDGHGKWIGKVRGVTPRYAVRIAPETFAELRQLASEATPDYEAFSFPDPEKRLWFNQGAHPDWRESNMPHRDPSARGAACVQCGRRLRGQRAVVWCLPTKRFEGEWAPVGLHLPTCSDA